jgi:hypothetical protein
MKESHVDCLWWDSNNETFPNFPGSPFFRKSSNSTIEQIVYNVAKHISLGLYTLAQNFCATSDTFTITINSAGSRFPSSKLHIALELTVNPSSVYSFGPNDLSYLQETGLLVKEGERFVEAPLKPLWHEHFKQDTNTSPEAANAADHIGLVFLDTDSPNHPWRGAKVGIPNGFGPQSTLSHIVAEFGRQVGPELRLFSIVSAIATKNQTAFVIRKSEDQVTPDCNNHNSNIIDTRLNMAFQLLKSGGLPLDEHSLERAMQLGLLSSEKEP